MSDRTAGRGWGKIDSVVIVGAKGMLGAELVEVLSGSDWAQGAGDHRIYAGDIAELDITDRGSVRRYLKPLDPQLVINCAAYTDVDGCESHRAEAFAVNADGAGNLAEVCGELDAKLVHISTDFVFDGKASSAYRCEDEPDPLSVYGQSKLAGERAVEQGLADHLIVRISWLFGKYGRNFVTTMRRLAQEREYLEVVDDQIGSPTYAVDLAEALLYLVGVEAVGMYHFRNEGQCSWYEFACRIVQEFGLSTPVRPITSEQLKRPAPRPSWSVLDISKYKQATGQSVRGWPEALDHYVKGCLDSEA